MLPRNMSRSWTSWSTISRPERSLIEELEAFRHGVRTDAQFFFPPCICISQLLNCMALIAYRTNISVSSGNTH